MKKFISSSLAVLSIVSSSNLCTNQLYAAQKDIVAPKNRTITKCCLKVAKDILSAIVPAFVAASIYKKFIKNSEPIPEFKPNGTEKAAEGREELQQEDDERDRREAEEQRRAFEEEQIRLQEEEAQRKRIEENVKQRILRRKERERLQREEQERLRREEQRRLQREEQERLRREEQRRLQREEQERFRREEQERLQREEQERRHLEALKGTEEYRRAEARRLQIKAKKNLSMKRIFDKYDVPVLTIKKEDIIDLSKADSDDSCQKLCVENAKIMKELYEKQSKSSYYSVKNLDDIIYLNIRVLCQDCPICIIEYENEYYVPLGHGVIFFDSTKVSWKGNKRNTILNSEANESDQVYENIWTCVSHPYKVESYNNGIISFLRVEKFQPSFNSNFKQFVDYLATKLK